MGPSLATIEQLREFETALVAEALAALGHGDPQDLYVGQDIKLLTRMNEPMVGVALNMLADTSTPGSKPDIEGLWQAYEMVRASDVPTVVVMKAAGSRPLHECMLGDGMAKILKACGSSGLIGDGAARDVNRINQVGYTVYGTGTVSSHVSLIFKLVQDPVTLSGATFTNGDLIHGDTDGLLIIPAKYHRAIVEACVICRDFETRVHVFWRRSDKTPREKENFAKTRVHGRNEKLEALMRK